MQFLFTTNMVVNCLFHIVTLLFNWHLCKTMHWIPISSSTNERNSISTRIFSKITLLFPQDPPVTPENIGILYLRGSGQVLAASTDTRNHRWQQTLLRSHHCAHLCQSFAKCSVPPFYYTTLWKQNQTTRTLELELQGSVTGNGQQRKQIEIASSGTESGNSKWNEGMPQA